MTEQKTPKKASPNKGGRPKKSVPTHLSLQQERFVLAYLETSPVNATLAYRHAGYRLTGKAASAAASRLLKQPAIKAAVAQIRARAAEKAEVTQQRVLEEYAKLAFADPRNFFHADGELKHPTELDDATAAALVQFEVEEEYTKEVPDAALEPQGHGGALKRPKANIVASGRIAKIKWSDKRAALDSIVRLMGWAKEDKQLGTPENPVRMIIADIQGRKSALLPVQDDEDDEDDE